MPDDARVTQWRTRANLLIAESTRTREALVNELPRFQLFAFRYLQALHHYTMSNARGEEREMLLELGRRAGQRSLRFSQRNEVADSQMRDEERLHMINRQIFVCQILIMLGKLAEAGLGAYTWFKNTKEVLDQLEQAKLIVDAWKTAQSGAAEILAAAGTGTRDASLLNVADTAGQFTAVLLRMGKDFKDKGVTIWNLLATIRRARNMNDALTAAAAIAQILKTGLELLVDFVDGQSFKKAGIEPSGATVAQLQQWKNFARNLGVLRDCLEAGRAFLAACDAATAMRLALEGMERQIAQGSRFIGSEKEALASLPRLGELSQESIGDLAEAATDFNAARVMANAARQEAKRIQLDIAAAARLHQEQNEQFQSATQRSKPLLEAVEEYIVRIGLLIAEMAYFADPAGVNRQASGAAVKELVDRLTKQRDLLRRTCEEFKLEPAVR